MKIHLGFLKRISLVLFGKDVTLALIILHLIAKAFGKTPPGELARFVFMQLPVDWKSPAGPTTEQEFLDMIAAGITFYRTARSVMT